MYYYNNTNFSNSNSSGNLDGLLVFVSADLMQCIEPCLGVLDLHCISVLEVRLVNSQP
jgi:hypothetical protein